MVAGPPVGAGGWAAQGGLPAGDRCPTRSWPASDSWEPGPSLNHVRTDPFVVECAGRIWAIGRARHNSGPKLDTVESIGPGGSTWSEEAPLPQPTRQGHACALDGIVYCFSIDGALPLTPALDAAPGARVILLGSHARGAGRSVCPGAACQSLNAPDEGEAGSGK